MKFVELICMVLNVFGCMLSSLTYLNYINFFAGTASALDDLTSGEESPSYWLVLFEALYMFRYLGTNR